MTCQLTPSPGRHETGCPCGEGAPVAPSTGSNKPVILLDVSGAFPRRLSCPHWPAVAQEPGHGSPGPGAPGPCREVLVKPLLVRRQRHAAGMTDSRRCEED